MKAKQALSLVFLLSGAAAVAVDLDVPAAKAKYESQRRVADAAKARLDTQAAILAGAEAEVRRAEREEAAAESKKSQEESRLQQMERAIGEMEKRIRDISDDIDEGRRQLTDLGGRVDGKRRERDRLQGDRDDLDRRIDRLQAQIKDLKDDDPQLPDLKKRLQNLRRQRDDVASKLSQAESQLSSLEYQYRELQNRVLSLESDLRDKQSELSSLERDRDRQERVVEDAREDLRRARQQTDFARQNVNAVRPAYLAAKSESDYQEGLAQEAYRYYQQVLADYNAALAAVYAKADAAARADAGREAADRAPQAGAGDGARAGRAEGDAKGLADIRLRELLKGYLDGRAKAATDGALAGAYAAGRTEGRRLADAKAIAERFPKGWNDALRAHLGAPPAQTVTVDISETVSSDPGGNGHFLKLAEKSVGVVDAPGENVPESPVFGPPDPGNPAVSVPALLKTYFNPPCGGLVLAEFEPLCRNRYESAYGFEFASEYRRIYVREYAAAHGPAAGAAYQAVLAKTDGAAFQQGRANGAREQGVLDGFAAELPQLEAAQYGAGKQALLAELGTGAQVILRGAELRETSGDGLLSPGESARLVVTLDNYGLQATALGRLRLRSTGSEGLGQANFTVRELPALAAHTRTVLVGTVAAPVTAEASGDRIRLEAALEADTGSGFQPLVAVKAEGEAGFPLELVDIELPKEPKVDETVTAKFKFRNRTPAPIQGAKADLDSSPQFVSFPGGQVDLPEVAPGAEALVDVDLKPGPWVGDNTYVRFLSRLTFADGRAVTQAFRKVVTVDRSVSLLLFDGSMKPVPSSTLRARAGSQLAFYAQLVYRATQSLPGPFVLRAGKTSDPAITHASGSTISVNYGSLWPGVKLNPVRLVYNIPQSLKGKSGWLMVHAEERNQVRHAMMVYLDVY